MASTEEKKITLNEKKVFPPFSDFGWFETLHSFMTVHQKKIFDFFFNYTLALSQETHDMGKVFKSGPSKNYGTQPSNYVKVAFHKFYLVHSKSTS